MAKRDLEVIAEFQRRRQRMLQGFGCGLILLALALVCLQVADISPGLMGMDKRGWRGVAGVQLLLGVGMALLGVLQYRCPVCRHLPRSQSSPLGVSSDPARCSQCGVRLR